ncbi:MAG: DUF3368 domain-containing protein [Candidatus Schekmanbacteria bacterium]|nr:DUF3368 domain-containing protein [Candidatus Schekmanbacteria bacterium]
MKAVFDSTPLILLAKISKFELLKKLFSEIHIPRQVYDDVVVMGKGKPGEKELKAAKGNWINVDTVFHRGAVEKIKGTYKLHPGESEAIVLASELKAKFFFTDDESARKAAISVFENTGTEISGTIGILDFGKKAGLISKQEYKDSIRLLKERGYYLSEKLYQKILKQED